MATLTSTPRKTQGRARGLLLVWKKELEPKLQINNYLPGHGGGDTVNYDGKKTRGPTADLRQPRIEDSHMKSTQT